MTKTLFEILEVEYGASEKQIKKAYYNLALKWHPDSFDRGNSLAKTREEAEAKFKEIADAYEILSEFYREEQYETDFDPEDYETENFSFYEPGWKEKLAKDVEEYLKNGASEKTKSEYLKRLAEIERERQEFLQWLEEFDRRFEESEKRLAEAKREMEESERRRDAETERKIQEIQERFEAKKKEVEEPQKSWEEVQERANKPKTVSNLPEWTVLNGGEWWWLMNIEGTLIDKEKNELEYGKILNGVSYDAEKKEIIRLIKKNKGDWEIKKIYICEKARKFLGSKKVNDTLIVHKSFSSRELRNKNNGDLFLRDEDGKFIINEEICGKVHWESGFNRKEREQIRAAIEQYPLGH
jgi:curved DNA-binding protein CbpA